MSTHTRSTWGIVVGTLVAGVAAIGVPAVGLPAIARDTPAAATGLGRGQVVTVRPVRTLAAGGDVARELAAFIYTLGRYSVRDRSAGGQEP